MIIIINYNTLKAEIINADTYVIELYLCKKLSVYNFFLKVASFGWHSISVEYN